MVMTELPLAQSRKPAIPGQVDARGETFYISSAIRSVPEGAASEIRVRENHDSHAGHQRDWLRTGFAFLSQGPADSGSRVFDHEGPVGRWLENLQPKRARRLARRHHPLAKRTPHSRGLRRITI